MICNRIRRRTPYVIYLYDDYYYFLYDIFQNKDVCINYSRSLKVRSYRRIEKKVHFRVNQLLTKSSLVLEILIVSKEIRY